MKRKRKQADQGPENKKLKCEKEIIKVVKSGLNHRFPNSNEMSRKLCEKIKADVAEISALAYEASLYIYFDLHTKFEDGSYNGKKIDFLSYFYSLLDTKKQSNSLLYEELRASMGMGCKYDKSYRSNLFVSQANLYTTIFENNIWMYAWSRIRKFLKNINPKADKKTILDTLFYLFYDSDEEQKEDKEILNTPWTRGYFCNLKRDVYSRLADFYLIWKINSINKYKNFQLIPQFSLRFHHINYDKFAFYQLLCSIQECPKKYNEKSKRNVNQTFTEFSSTFKFSRYMKVPENTKSFTTDGVTCCIRLLIEKKPTITTSSSSFDIKSTSVNIGIDPGSRLFLGGVRTTNHDPYGPNQKIKYSSRQFYTECGHYSRKNKLDRWTRKSQAIEKNRKAIQTPLEYVKFALKHLKEKMKEFFRDKISRLKFDAYIQRKKTFHRVIREKFIGEEKETVTVFWGSAKQASNSPIKGYIKSPHSQIIRELKHHPKIQFVEVDEYRSTKVCSSCLTDANHKVSKSPHRFSCCTQCKIVWNRDVNAGLNILFMGYLNYTLRKKLN